MRITDAPALLPGACFVTGAIDGPFIDTNRDIEDLAPHGRVYLAVSTVEDMAQMLGMASREAAERMARERAELRELVAAKDEEIARLRGAVEALRAAGYTEEAA